MQVQKELKKIEETLSSRGFLKQAKEIQAITEGLHESYPPFRGMKRPASPDMPFAVPGEKVEELIPSAGGSVPTYYKLEDPHRFMYPNLDDILEAIRSGRIPERALMHHLRTPEQRGEFIRRYNPAYAEEILEKERGDKGRIEERFREQDTLKADPMDKVRQLREQQRKTLGLDAPTNKEASVTLMRLSYDLCDRGYTTLGDRLFRTAVELVKEATVHPRHKEHTIPSIEAIHEYVEDPDKFEAILENLSDMYKKCESVVRQFKTSYKQEMVVSKKTSLTEHEKAQKIHRMVRSVDGEVNKKVLEFERTLPKHPGR